MNIDIKVLNDNIDRYEDIVKNINLMQNEFNFKLSSLEIVDLNEGIRINKKILYNVLNNRGQDKTIYIMKNNFDDDYFSHNKENIAIVSCNSWNDLFDPTAFDSYIIYQISIALLEFLFEIDEKEFTKVVAHRRTTACVLDFCEDKRDILIGLKVGILCDDCKKRLRRRATDNEIQSIEALIKYSSDLYKGIHLNLKGIFVVMEYNDKNTLLYDKTIKPAIEELGFECYRADENILDRFIYRNVIKNISENKYIIVISSNNNNVYLELGYALALNKDIMLLKHTNDNYSIPTDISNLIYIEFDNEYDLKEKIRSFFEPYIVH